MKIVVALAAAMLLAGCVGHGTWGERQGWPSTQNIGAAAKSAAVNPQTWVPMATAALLIAADVDNKWSEDIAENSSVFGGNDDADDVGDTYLDIASGAYIVTALLAPSPTLKAKLKGLAVGAGTIFVDGAVTEGLKALTDRERPSRTNNNSMPSGHASKVASRGNMAMRNLQYMDIPEWSRQAATWSLHGLGIVNDYSRVEAGKHHISDVLVGRALGNFFANFMYAAFLEGTDSQAMISFQPVPDGGALTLTVPLR